VAGNAGPSIHAVPAQSASIRESDWQVVGDGCPARLCALRYRGSAALASAFTRPSRIVSIWGFCLPRARGIASPSPAKPCPGNADGVVASGHRRIDENSVCRGRQPICGRRSAQSPVAPDNCETIACRAARVVQAVGCLVMGQSLPKCDVSDMSGLPPIATEHRTSGDVSNGPN
jgi:hypothetical protein